MGETAKITQSEMIEMFGEAMPMVAVNLVFDAPPEKTIGEIRAELREISLAPQSVDEVARDCDGFG